MIEVFDPRETSEMRLKAWSHSRIIIFESCKFRSKLQYIDRIPEPERPLPPGKTEHPNDRGTRIHEAAEAFVKGGVELIPELEKFKPELEKLRKMLAEGLVSLEGEWAFNRAWEPVAWMSHDTWCRIKLDAVAWLESSWAVVVDYKSGKRFGNEIKHGEQMQLYVLGCFLRFPKLKKVTVELWYTDLDELVTQTYTREQAMRFKSGYEARGEKMTTCEDFPPNPNRFSCKWCPYKPVEKGGTGHCSVGV